MQEFSARHALTVRGSWLSVGVYPMKALLPILGCVCALAGGLAVNAAAPEPVVVPRLTHPGTGQVFYFVLTDRFANGIKDNDTGGIPGGRDENGYDPTVVSHFHGGDFAGLMGKLDYLQGLGITAVWVTPPFQNKAVQAGSAGYHGYWVTDFLKIDSHLGTNADFAEFVRQAHARGMRVIMDIIVNHTADVIVPGGGVGYVETKDAPYRDAAGVAFDIRQYAWNGQGAARFPSLDAATSFARPPSVPAVERSIKNPAWLNDVTLYHNRGNSAFKDESSTHGDFVGLDDLMTEHPRVVAGMIEVFSGWIRDFGVDGFRIDTARHVNGEFWQAFGPAIREAAKAVGKPAFIQFGEVANESLDISLLSEFSTYMPLDTTLDFGFFAAARNFISKGGTAAAMTDLIERDDLYTDHDSNIHATTTFIGNHDAGRFGYFLQQDNPGASPALLADLVKLGHGLLYLSRGQPVLYYGDEQGMIGRGGNDMQAREDMFPAQAPDFRDAPLLGTTRTGASDKFDPTHPFYQFFSRLAALRAGHVALRTGAMLVRETGRPELFAFSRIERSEKIEYVVVLNNARRETLRTAVPTSQPAGARWTCVFDSRSATTPTLAAVTDAAGRLSVDVEPLQFSVWRAEAPLPTPAGALRVAVVNPSEKAALGFGVRDIDGHLFPTRQELRAEVGNNDGVAEVTFTLQRASRPGQSELLGTDDAPPYRVFWRPPADLAPGETFTVVASANDLRGRVAADAVTGLTVQPSKAAFGIQGATVPSLTVTPAPTVVLGTEPVTLSVQATGTAPLNYQWLCDGEAVAGATQASLQVTKPGRYEVMVRNLAGTTVGPATRVRRE